MQIAHEITFEIACVNRPLEWASPYYTLLANLDTYTQKIATEIRGHF
jgi:hypothetical protein